MLLYSVCLTVLVANFGVLFAHPDGAPLSACNTLTPVHGEGEPDTSTSPFALSLSSTSARGGDVIVVTLQGQNDETFEGYLIQARSNDDPSLIVGSFVESSFSGKTLDCNSYENSAATHSEASSKTSVDIEWTTPSDFSGDVFFIASVVEDFSTFWVNITSEDTLTVSYAVSNPYENCGTNKYCVGYPDDCVSTEDCDIVMTSVYQDGRIDFVMQGTLSASYRYIAKGLSFDNMMGDDFVVGCFVDDTSSPVVQISWNYAGSDEESGWPTNGPLTSDSSLSSDVIYTDYTDGVLTCAFSSDVTFTVRNITFDLTTTDFYVVLAGGNTTVNDDGEQVLVLHDMRLVSDSPVNFITSTSASTTSFSYDGCGTTKTCIGITDGCVSSSDCDLVTAFYYENGAYNFEIEGTLSDDSSYIAMGLSFDNAMGDDSVVGCFPSDVQNVVQMSWNDGTPTNYPISSEQYGLSNIVTQYTDGVLYCSFQREEVTTVEGSAFDLANDEYYILLAAGPLTSDGEQLAPHTSESVSDNVVQIGTVELEGTTTPTATSFSYTGCGSTKTCFGSPTGCESSGNCDYVTAFAYDGGNYVFELEGTLSSDSRYVAIGLSFDSSMGDDSVVGCFPSDDGAVVQMSWNDETPTNIPLSSAEHYGLSNIVAQYTDGTLYCSFYRDRLTAVENIEFDLANDEFYILIAAGPLNSNGEQLGQHDSEAASDSAVQIGTVEELTSSLPSLVKAHAVLMALAWCFSVSIGSLLARYYKNTWTGIEHCGKPIWFAYHRCCMLTAFVFSIAGFLVIMAQYGTDPLTSISSSGNPHAAFGVASIILCVAQPIIAEYRCGPKDPLRPLFNWAHFIVGGCALLSAIFAIFFAISLDALGLSTDTQNTTYGIVGAFVGFYVLTHVFLTFNQIKSNKALAHMKRLDIDNKGDAPGSKVRKITLYVYVTVALVLTVVELVYFCGASS